jgi:hemerythrin-like domain-containing protein
MGSNPIGPTGKVPMDPHDQFIADHSALKIQAADLRKAIEGDAAALATQLVSFQKATSRHFSHEDIYYRILDADKRLEDRGLVHQLRNDHAAVIFTLESLAIRLRKNGVNDDWLSRFNNLMNVFLPHLDQEEQTLFPIGRKTLSREEITKIVSQIESSE